MPTLTPDERAQIEKEVVKQRAVVEAMTAAGPAKQARADELGVTDGVFKKFFDYYNDSIIGKYDAERRALNGDYIALPITEADVEGPATLDTAVRTTPTLPATDIVRVTQFDGTPTVTDPLNEQQHISDQAALEDGLANGLQAPTLFATTVTASDVNGATTSVDIEDPNDEPIFSVYDYFVVEDGSTSALLKITSVTPGPAGPPYTFTLGVEVVVAPSGTIVAGADVVEFDGFTDGERSTKTASDAFLQNILDGLIEDLEDAITARIARLDEQLAALAANQDPDGTSQITTATTNANTSKTFLNAYLATTDVSDTGLSSLATERGTRGAEITARLVQISANYTGQTENYYDRRYDTANDRGNTARGSRRLQVATLASVDSMTGYADSAQDALDALLALLEN